MWAEKPKTSWLSLEDSVDDVAGFPAAENSVPPLGYPIVHSLSKRRLEQIANNVERRQQLTDFSYRKGPSYD